MREREREDESRRGECKYGFDHDKDSVIMKFSIDN